ncbi:HSP90 chaperone [Halogranum tailed virus 1]|uniref:HSP90 chaperone n=1 Tax=Halogranum tailed virus 1 TaxID=1273749 RepID=R4T6Y8_9CAUD|nr:HSP90 chaperone [Halogranum tailed virus 1]AGM11469.1 HSP90 chaperone [Halogranum tailed virus 1]
MSERDNSTEDAETADDGFNPVYQEGKTSVQHKNLNAAGSDHPLGADPLSFEADLRHLIRKVADDLYESWEATIREYLANAETACLRVQNFLDHGTETTLNVDSLYGTEDGYEPRIEVTWDRSENKVEIRDNGIGMASKEVDEVFRQIGNSAARDTGSYSGQFGMGALSFVKLIGLDNSMVMTTHSRQTDENFSTYVSLAGPEPIMGKLPEDQYGTKFQMTPDGNFDIRSAVERFAEWMRVPVIYREYDETGQEVFNEDWGDKQFTDEYDPNMITLELKSEGDFVATCSAEASTKTLLLSMPIDRNDSGGKHGAPFPFDVRLLDESGKVIKSDQGYEGLMPCPRSDYREMLKEARDPYITRELLNAGDIVGQEVAEGPNEGSMVVTEDTLSADRPLPPHDYITRSDLSEDDEPGQARVIFGPHKGKTIVDEDEWDSMDAGRAELYVPEDELEPFDIHSESGDLTLPEPTSDRDRLQSHDVFWKWVGAQFKDQFEGRVVDVFDMIDGTNDPLQTILELEPENLVESTARVQ